MNLKQYQKISVFFKKYPCALAVMKQVNRLLTLLGFLAYPCLLLLLLFFRDERLFCYIVVPALSFLLVSFFRKKINCPRPYEKFPIRPAIKKDTRGHSFPSRHVFSMFLIAALWVSYYLPAGIFLLISGTVLAAIRVVGGVHFIKDVLCGAAIGGAAGAASCLICKMMIGNFYI